MSTAAILILIIAGALHTRLGRLTLAHWLLKAGRLLSAAGGRVLDHAKLETPE